MFREVLETGLSAKPPKPAGKRGFRRQTPMKWPFSEMKGEFRDCRLMAIRRHYLRNG